MSESDLTFVVQEPQLGTAHALMATEPTLQAASGLATIIERVFEPALDDGLKSLEGDMKNLEKVLREKEKQFLDLQQEIEILRNAGQRACCPYPFASTSQPKTDEAVPSAAERLGWTRPIRNASSSDTPDCARRSRSFWL